ncbi:hypothetical protein R5W24_000364 [Gemmata sp. JC717]|uniref:HlyD family secretion protein n=1 Tax=Gemmata algarum TaxID=2975278 RepID=UPI0021BB8B43|nr:hypothetical protein [Gemmata algarum]MDY3551289.1 hypothetical protein [Gemmata algarum]
MTWLRKMRPVLIVIGLGLAVGSLVGARALTHGSGSEATTKGADVPPPRAAGGPVVLGTVDTDPSPVDYRLPSVLQAGTVSKVFVKDGDTVEEKQPLYAFDDAVPRANLEHARTAVALARTKVKEAEEGKKQHANKVEVAKKGVEALKRRATDANNLVKLTRHLAEDSFRLNSSVKPEEWETKLQNEPAYLDAQSKYTAAFNEWQIKEAELGALQTVDTQVLVEQAQAAVKEAEAKQSLAQTMLDLYVVKAQTAGTVEHLSIQRGSTIGQLSRAPALWLIPTGPRVVRAEVEAEFAHRVGPDRIGKPVTIMDHSDAKLTYTGTIRRIPDAFLRKRGSAENILASETLVLEAVIDITDHAPAGKPPLRVGQRVRVNMGQ